MIEVAINILRVTFKSLFQIIDIGGKKYKKQNYWYSGLYTVNSNTVYFTRSNEYKCLQQL